jgi:c-di-GMP-binding flagellar brake protein YcgR
MARMQKTKQTDIDSEVELNLRLLPAGSTVVLEVSTPTGQKKKVHSTFIGYLPKQYILIQYPDPKKLGHFSDFLNPGATVTIRGLHEGLKFAIVAFTGHVKQTLLQPSKTIVLEIPKEIRVLYLRSGIRLQTQIEANVEFDDTSYPAQITNLSPTGCQLILSSKKPPTLANEVEVEITVEKHKDQESFAVKACVCNSKEVQGGLSVGVRFIEDNLPEVEALLYQALSLED